jgi:ferric-dicitrate binding protein FerR (iron transport regulator)
MGPTTSSPIDRDVLTGFRAGDESSLERVFRERFASLTDEARQQFGETNGPAPKIVERAFVRAWEERTRFETPESLEAFLHDSVHDQVVRERSRIAALHRIDGHDAGRAARNGAAHRIEPIPLDEAWKHVHAMLHPASAEVRHKAYDESRHESAHHMASIAKGRSLKLPLITAAVIAAVILGGLWWVDQNSEVAAISAALSAPDSRSVTSGAGQIGTTQLRDGSTAKVGPDTKLSIAAGYGSGAVRAVKLDQGAASFQVRSGLKEPFAVRVRDVTIFATGTAFDVTAFQGEPNVYLRVREGTVDVRGEGDPRVVSAGQAVSIDDDGNVADAAGPALQEAVGWVDGKFTVANRPLKQVLPLLTRWYRIDLQVRDESLLARPVTATAPLDSSMAAIRAIEQSTGLKFDWDNKTMILRDPAKPLPAKK